MRFALVIEPPDGGDHVDRLGALRLTVARAGFNVVRLRAEATHPKKQARAVEATEPHDTALVYIAGDVRLDAGAIVLAGLPPLPLAELASIVYGRPVPAISPTTRLKFHQLLFVVDARCDGEKGDAMNALEHVEAIVKAIGPREHSTELLVAVESSPLDAPPAFALTRFFVQALEDPTALAADGTMHMSSAYERMTAHPEFRPSVPSFSHAKGPSDFVIVAPMKERVSGRRRRRAPR